MGNCFVTVHEKQKPVDQSPPVTATGARDEKNIPMAAGAGGDGGAVVRIKLVISKQELKEMIRSGSFSIGGLIAGASPEESGDFEGKLRSFGWSPALESIPEGNGL